MSKDDSSRKTGLVIGLRPEQYVLHDTRLNKPRCFKKLDDGTETGSMLVQEMDELRIDKRTLLHYFTPNNIGVLLSVAGKALERAKQIKVDRLDPERENLTLSQSKGNKVGFLNEKSSDVCDFIEEIQTSVVFGYTALEAFANISIPGDYVYAAKVEPKGTTELYDKQAIERWVSLKDKLLIILPDVYDSRKPSSDKSWAYFVKLEQYRHEIIHQKSIRSTEFYKAYFRRDIYEVCQSAQGVIRFFCMEHAADNRTNPLWPWLIESENHFPVSYDIESEDLQVIGNVFEGFRSSRR